MSSTTTQTRSSTTLSGAQDPSYIPRGPVTTTLNFFEDPSDGAKPFNYVEPQPEGQPQRNFGINEVELEMNDIRGHEKDYYLEKDAFEVVQGFLLKRRTLLTISTSKPSTIPRWKNCYSTMSQVRTR